MPDKEKLIELLDTIHHKPLGKTYQERIETIADFLIANGVTVQRWIPVTERLPEERVSIFAKNYGTSKWLPGMFKTISSDVIATVLLDDGRKIVREMHTTDGKWHMGGLITKGAVIAWMEKPAAYEQPKEDAYEN